VIAHIGSRGGFAPLEFPEWLDPLLFLEAFDGDANVDLSQLELLDGRRCQVETRHSNVVLAEESGPCKFVERACPFTSGVVGFNQRFYDWYVYANGPCDYVLGQAHEVRHERSFEARSLNDLIANRMCESPSILVIDAQGASPVILRGGSQVLSQTVDAVVCEVELAPIYGDSISFAEVLELLWGAGLAFAGFVEEETSWASPVRLPIGQRSDPLPIAKDARFLRLPATMPSSAAPERVAKYVAIACMFGYPDFGIVACQRFAEALRGTRSSDVPPELLDFCKGLDDAARSMPHVFPVSFSEAAALQSGQAISDSVHDCSLHALGSLEPTAIEAHLTRHGFVRAAQVIRRNRFQHLRGPLGTTTPSAALK